MNYTYEVFFKQEKDTKGARNRHIRDGKTNWHFVQQEFLLSFIKEKVHNEGSIFLDQRNNYLSQRWKFGILRL